MQEAAEAVAALDIAVPQWRRRSRLRAHRNYKLVRREWATAVSAAAEGEGSVEATLPLLRKVADGLVHLRQAESRR
jgi:hypothetical protein